MSQRCAHVCMHKCPLLPRDVNFERVAEGADQPIYVGPSGESDADTISLNPVSDANSADAGPNTSKRLCMDETTAPQPTTSLAHAVSLAKAAASRNARVCVCVCVCVCVTF